MPFWLYLILPIGGVNFLATKLLYLSIDEWFLIFTVFWFGLIHKKRTSYTAVILIFSFFTYLLFYTIPALEDASRFESLKTLKPYFFISIVVVFLALKDKTALISADRLAHIILFVICFDVTVWGVSIYIPEIMPEGIRKEFFIRNNVYRYFDSAILLLQSVIIFGFWLFISYLIVVALSHDRMFMIFGFVVLLVYSNIGVTLITMLLLAVLSVIFYSILDQYVTPEVATRFINLTSPDLVLRELFARFIEPVVEGGYELNLKTFLFGEGVNFKFYIPWYEYREIDVYHNSVDSFFVTFFVKHGILGVIIFYSIVHQVLRKFPKVLYAWILLYLLVHNGLYVTSFLMMLIFLSFLYDFKVPKKE